MSNNTEDNTLCEDKSKIICEEEKNNLCEEENNICCCSGKQKQRTEQEKRELINRLSRIEGQIRGIKNMIEKNAYCTDVLIQVAAASSALGSFNRVLLTNHIKTCVAENIRSGNDDVIDELTLLLQKLMK